MSEVARDLQIAQDLGRSVSVNEYGLAPKSFEEIVSFAQLMSGAGPGIPKPFRSQPGLCMSVVMLAHDLRMNPFSVINKAYVVNDRVAYETQFIVAMVNSRANLAEPLIYEYSGEEADMQCTVTGVFKSGGGRSYTSPKISEIPTKNSPLWKSDPKQQLAYFAARSWARRYCPEVIMGLYTPEEAEGMAEMKDITDANPLGDVKEIEGDTLEYKEDSEISEV